MYSILDICAAVTLILLFFHAACSQHYLLLSLSHNIFCLFLNFQLDSSFVCSAFSRHLVGCNCVCAPCIEIVCLLFSGVRNPS